MAASQKVHGLLTKYLMYINQGYYVIYLKNMKFMKLIFWPGGVYTDDTYTTKVKSMIPYYDPFHESWLYRLIRMYAKWAKKSNICEFGPTKCLKFK